MSTRQKHFYSVVILTFSTASLLFGDIKLPAIIGSNMALQQNTEVSIWGWADHNEKISIKGQWQKLAVLTEADSNGKWIAKIKTPKAGGPYTLTIKGNNTIKLENVIIGEVWLCSGQSNMEMPMVGWPKMPVCGGPEDIENSLNKKIRLFHVNGATADKPIDDVAGKWVVCSPETVKKFTAVGYYFGRQINEQTGYPVGLISSAWGGTMAEAWTCTDSLRNNDNLSPIIDLYNERFQRWEKACLEAEKQQKTKPEKQFPIRAQDKPASLYNGMIAPITNMTIKGVIWYQGESNTGATYTYRYLFPTMIQSWRSNFNNYNMPFYFVQLANFSKQNLGIKVDPYRGLPRESRWAELREAQFMANSIKNTGMAVAIDIGETNNIHPCRKKEVGERLALWALAKNYGKDIEYSGPLYEGYHVEGNKIRITFSHADGGLVFTDGKAGGFAIAGKERKFLWANVKIDGETVIVFNPDIKEPVSVRYAWDVDPENTLCNKAGLPASPFRTDDWNKNSKKNKSPESIAVLP